jgi:hypothetical protein
MRLQIIRLSTLVGLAGMGLASLLYADPLIVPPGLSVGDQYRLAFVTSAETNAESSNIADYNAFVTAQANLDPQLAALGVTWQVIGSTAAVDAYNNIGGTFTAPIYNLGGQLVATGSAGLWSGNNLDNPINFDQFGDTLDGYLWTGTVQDGTTDNALGSGNPEFAYSGVVDVRWIADGGGNPETGDPSTSSALLYGISPVLTVESPAVPEPGTFSLMMLGVMFLAGKVRSKRTDAAMYVRQAL